MNMIEHTREKNGLHLREGESGTTCSSPLSYLFESSGSNKAEVWLPHLHLGHPPFRLSKKMFPIMFQRDSKFPL